MRVGHEASLIEPVLVPFRFDRLRFVGLGNPGHIFFNHGWTRMDTDREGSYDDAFPFQFRVLEIQNQANPKLCSSQIGVLSVFIRVHPWLSHLFISRYSMLSTS